MYIYFPSEQLRKEIQAETNYLWVIQAENRAEPTFILKAPTPIIKSILQDACCSLLMTKVVIDGIFYLVTEFLVRDTSDHIICISNTQRNKDNYTALSSFIKSNNAKIVLYNELNNILASTNIEYNSVTVFGKRLNNEIIKNTVSIANNFNLINKILDTLDEEKSNIISDQSEYTLKFKEWSTISTVLPSLSSATAIEYDIKDLDDGIMQENAIIGIFRHTYDSIYHAPILREKNKDRELVDVLIETSKSYILFESKSQGINKYGHGKSSARNSSNIQKNTKKALRQLTGAVKKMTNISNSIFVEARTENFKPKEKIKKLRIDLDKDIHAVILLSEIRNNKDVNLIINEVMELRKAKGFYLHVIELKEIPNMLNIAQHNKKTFDDILIERFQLATKTKNMNIGHFDPSLPMT